MKRRFLIIASGLAMIVLLGTMLMAVIIETQIYGRPLFAPSPHRLPEIGASVVEGLSRYHARHGKYPRSLEEGKISNVETPYGGFRYWVSDGVANCKLTIGDYGKHLFIVSWDSEGGWYVDT